MLPLPGKGSGKTGQFLPGKGNAVLLGGNWGAGWGKFDSGGLLKFERSGEISRMGGEISSLGVGLCIKSVKHYNRAEN